MSRESRYKTGFEFIEQEMIGVGIEYEDCAKEFSQFKTNPENVRYSSFGYVRRLSWLEKIIDAIEAIYEEVNSTTKEIITLLYKDGKSMEEVSTKLAISHKRLIRQHNLIVDEVMEMIGMHVERKTKYEKTERYIPTHVRTKVFERDNGKCIVCGSEEKIHYHHIRKFSDGGTHTVNNLTLLCSACHADEHKGEREYNLLKSNS